MDANEREKIGIIRGLRAGMASRHKILKAAKDCKEVNIRSPESLRGKITQNLSRRRLCKGGLRRFL
jgi:hypothetical protein